MSNICRICEKVFKYSYQLKRHENKKNSCKVPNHIKLTIENKLYKLEEIIIEQGQLLIQQDKKLIDIQEQVKAKTTCSKEYRCEYCYHNFSRLDNLERHVKEQSCKYKNDNVIIYEKELGITKKEVEPLKCRFCMIKFSNPPSYSRHLKSDCKAKLKYEMKLQSLVQTNRKKVAASVSFNGNQNKNYSDNTTNNIVNNIYLPHMNAFGNENLDYITTKMLIKQIELSKDFSDITDTLKTFTELIHAHPAHPENHNVLMKDNHGALSTIFNGENMEQVNSIGIQDQILSKVGKLLVEKSKEYTDINNKKNKYVSKEIDKKLIQLEESVIDNIDEELQKKLDKTENGEENPTNSRNLGVHRNTIKGVLVSHKEEIKQTQTITCPSK